MRENTQNNLPITYRSKTIYLLIAVSMIYAFAVMMLFEIAIGLCILGVSAYLAWILSLVVRNIREKSYKSLIINGITARAKVLGCKEVKLGAKKRLFLMRLEINKPNKPAYSVSVNHRAFIHERAGFTTGNELLVKVDVNNPDNIFVITSLKYDKIEQYTGHDNDEEIKYMIADIAETNLRLLFSETKTKATIDGAVYSGININSNELWYFNFDQKGEKLHSSEIINLAYRSQYFHNQTNPIISNQDGDLMPFVLKTDTKNPKICTLKKHISGRHVMNLESILFIIVTIVVIMGIVIGGLIAFKDQINAFAS